MGRSTFAGGSTGNRARMGAVWEEPALALAGRSLPLSEPNVKTVQTARVVRLRSLHW